MSFSTLHPSLGISRRRFKVDIRCGLSALIADHGLADLLHVASQGEAHPIEAEATNQPFSLPSRQLEESYAPIQGASISS